MKDQTRSPFRRLLASVVTSALVASAAVLGVAAPAHAASYTLSADATEVANEKVAVSVSGSGYAEIPLLPGQPQRSFYVALIEKGTDLSTVTQGGSTVVAAVYPTADGSVVASLEQTADKLDRAKSYEVIAWPSRSNPSEANLYARTDVAIDWTALFPPASTTTGLTVAPEATSVQGTTLTLTANVEPADAAGTVTFSYTGGAVIAADVVVNSGVASTTVAPAVGSASFTAAYTPADSSAYAASASGSVSHVVTAPVSPYTLSADATEVADEKVTVAVSGSGYANIPLLPGQPQRSFYVAFIEKGSDLSTVSMSGSTVAAVYPNADGDFTGSVEQTAANLDESKSYEVIAWPSRSFPSETNMYARADVTIDWAALFPEEIPAPSLTVTPSTELDADGATVTVRGENFDTSAKALYGPGAGVNAAGFYAQIGWLDSTWRPSEDAPSGARSNAYSAWVQGVQTASPYLLWTENDNGTASFEWTLTIDKATLDAKAREGATLAVFTTGAGGVKQAVNELMVPITFAAAEPETPVDPEPETGKPVITVTPNSNLDPSVKNIVTVTGEGFTGASAVNGAYVAFGPKSLWSGSVAFPAEGWTTVAWVQPGQITDGAFSVDLEIPSGSLDPNVTYQVATSAAHGLSATDRSLDTFADVTVAQPAAPFVGFPLGTTVTQGGTLTFTAGGFAEGDRVTAVAHSEPVTIGTKTVGASGSVTFTWAVPADFETGAHTIELSVGGVVVASAPFTINPLAAVPADEAPVVAETCVAQSVTGATIQWGVKESYRSYITGSIANGSYSGGWGSGAGAYSTENDRGRVSYSGSIHYTGHSGALDMTLSNPRIQVTSATTASLILNVQSKGYGGSSDVNASGVVFATLALPAASESATSISWSNASATLTAAGAEAFGGFYSAGEALDSVSFTFPLGAEVPCDSTTDGSLANTGGSADASVIWIGASLLALGAVLVMARRRRQDA